MALAIGVGGPVQAAAPVASQVDRAEIEREQRFALQWSRFLIASLGAADERQRLVAAQLILAGASVIPDVSQAGVPTLADIARAQQVRASVHAVARDAVTLDLAAAQCDTRPHDDCDRAALLERAVKADPTNAWTWLQWGAEIGHRDPARAQEAFERAAAAPRFDEQGWNAFIAAVMRPLRRDWPAVDADLALMRVMGSSALVPFGVPAARFLSEQCNAQRLALPARAADCRRLAEAMGSQARTSLTLSMARSVGQRVALPPPLLAQWKARLDAVSEASGRLPLQPIGPGRELFLRWADDLVALGELQAAERLRQRPAVDAGRNEVPSDLTPVLQAAGMDIVSAAMHWLQGLAKEGSPEAALLTRAALDQPDGSYPIPTLSDQHREAIGRALAQSTDPALLSLGALACRRPDLGCDLSAVAARWVQVEPDNAAAWLFLAKVQLDAKSPGAARASLLQAAARPQYDGHGTARLRLADARLRAIPLPDQLKSSADGQRLTAFLVAAELSVATAVFGQSALRALCRADTDADLRSACRSIAHRIDASASIAAERELALDVLAAVGEPMTASLRREVLQAGFASRAIGYRSLNAARATLVFGNPGVARDLRPIADALLAHGELGAARHLLGLPR